MSSTYDSIIVGAGHNALVCATYLQKAGQKVLVLERSSQVGGLAAAYEFQPGFRAPIAHSATHFPEKIVRDLDLQAHGLQMESAPITLTALSPSGDSVKIRGLEISGVNAHDQEAWLRYSPRMEKFAAALAASWLETMPRLGFHGVASLKTFGRLGLNLKRLGKQDMAEFLRVFSLPMRDLMDEYFENPLLQAVLAWDGLIGSRMAPRSPNNSVSALLYRMSGQRDGQSMVPAGGVTALLAALEQAAVAAGVEIRTLAGVERIETRPNESGLQAHAVTLDDGSSCSAARIISSADPKTTFLDLLGAKHLEIGFSNRINRLRSQGLVAKVHLAVDGLPEFTGIDQPEGRLIVAPSLDHIEFAFDDSKYGKFSERPVLEISIPTLDDPSLAPEGRHVLSIHAMYAPAKLKGEWTYEARKAFTDAVLETLESCAPGLRSKTLGQELVTPADIESRYHLKGGHWHHGEMALDQLLMMRPTYEAAQYSTPINGLYLCGAGCHPAGDLTGMAGHNAAQEILR